MFFPFPLSKIPILCDIIKCSDILQSSGKNMVSKNEH